KVTRTVFSTLRCSSKKAANPPSVSDLIDCMEPERSSRTAIRLWAGSVIVTPIVVPLPPAYACTRLSAREFCGQPVRRPWHRKRSARLRNTAGQTLCVLLFLLARRRLGGAFTGTGPPDLRLLLPLVLGELGLRREGEAGVLAGPFAVPALDVDHHVLARADLAEQDLLRELILDLALDGATQRPRAQHRIESALGQQALG